MPTLGSAIWVSLAWGSPAPQSCGPYAQQHLRSTAAAGSLRCTNQATAWGLQGSPGLSLRSDWRTGRAHSKARAPSLPHRLTDSVSQEGQQLPPAKEIPPKPRNDPQHRWPHSTQRSNMHKASSLDNEPTCDGRVPTSHPVRPTPLVWKVGAWRKTGKGSLGYQQAFSFPQPNLILALSWVGVTSG